MTTWRPAYQEEKDQKEDSGFFNWIHRNIELPFAAVLSSPFTPDRGQTGENWLQREIAQYQDWEAPTFRTGVNLPSWLGGNELTFGVKGALETAPWFLLPTAGGTAARLGKIGASASRLAPAARVGAAALKPLAAIEAAPSKAVGKLVDVLKGAKTAQKAQAALLRAERSKRFAKVDEVLISETRPDKALIKARSALKGDYSKVTLPKGIDASDVLDLKKAIVSHPELTGIEKVRADDAITKLLNLQSLQANEIDLLGKAFGPDLTQAVLAARSTGAKIGAGLLDAANAPRAVLSAVDISFPFRQGAILLARHPSELPGNFKTIFKAFASKKNYEAIMKNIAERPHTALAKRSGLDFTEIAGKAASYGMREETFASRFASKLPLIGRSERSFVAGRNDLASRVWEKTIGAWDKIGAKYGETDLTELAKFINFATGRGTLPKAIAGAGPLLNATLFSPKLFFSRLQLPTTLFSSSPLVRKEAARTLVQFLGVGAGILSALHVFAGAEVELDPRSADFGKARIGKTRLDFWSGYAQYARFVAQLTTAERKTAGKNINELNRAEVVSRFFQSKFSPAAGLIFDILKGENYMGEELSLDTKSLSQQAYNRLTPLFIQDMIDAINEEGLQGGFLALPAIAGVGVVTYTDQVSRAREKAARQIYGMSWDEVGTTYGNLAQRKLEQEYEPLEAAIVEQEERTRGNEWSEWKEEGQGIEKRYQNAVQVAAQEFAVTRDGYTFREKVSDAALVKRQMYNERETRTKYKDIVKSFDKPLDPAGKNLLDVARNEYYQMLYADNMTDQFGNYDFARAEQVRQFFLQKYGQEALDYVEEYSGLKFSDQPAIFQELQKAQDVLKPYWNVTNEIIDRFGQRFADSKAGQRLISKYRELLRRQNQVINYYIGLFYTRP